MLAAKLDQYRQNAILGPQGRRGTHGFKTGRVEPDLPVNRCICFAAPLLSMFDYQLLAFLTNPSSPHSSEPTPLCTKNNPVGSYFFFTDASRA
jgi:hypothetical protein